MIKMNEWVGEYYTYDRLNSQGFCMLGDIDHALGQGKWDKAKAIEYVMFNHNIQKDQATGMVEWAMSMLTAPGWIHAGNPDTDWMTAKDAPEPDAGTLTEKIMERERHMKTLDMLDMTENAPEAEAAEAMESANENYLLLYKKDYPELAEAVGCMFNNSDEPDGTFRLPSFQGKFPPTPKVSYTRDEQPLRDKCASSMTTDEIYKKVSDLIQAAYEKNVSGRGIKYYQQHSNFYVSGDILQEFFYHLEKIGKGYADFAALYAKDVHFTVISAPTDSLVNYGISFNGFEKDGE